MLPELSSYITSFSAQSRRSIHSVLSESLRDKAEIGKLISNLSTFVGPADYSPRMIRQLEPMQREFIIDMFRDIDLRVKTEYDVSNSINNLSSAMTNIFGGELSKLEKDIQFLNSYVDNFSFISGEDDLYNASFIENFDNELNSILNENSEIVIPDRDLVPLTKELHAKVDNASGKLKFSSDYELSLSDISTNDIKSITYETNFPREYISTDTGLGKLFTTENTKSWNLTIKSPFVIKESLLDSEKYSEYKNGVSVPASAQVAVTVEFNSLKQMSRLRIISDHFNSLSLAQVIIETENSSSAGESSSTLKKKALLSSSISLQKVFDIDFDSKYFIKSITLILFTDNYHRTSVVPMQSELNSKLMSQVASEIKSDRNSEHDSLQEHVVRFFLRDTEKTFILRNKKLYSYNYTSYFPKPLSKTNFGVIEKLDRNSYFSDIDAFNKFRNTSLFSNIIFSIISYSIGSKLRNQINSTYIESNIKDTTKTISSYLSGGFIPLGNSNVVDANIQYFDHYMSSVTREDATQLLNNIEESNMYEYKISINGIFMFATTRKNNSLQTKSTFVSKKIPVNGRPMKVKMLADYFEELSFSSEGPEKDKTSIEFSVSIKEFPLSESDWLPILPYGDSSVRTELLILNSSGEGVMRFEPAAESVNVFENSERRIGGTFSVNGKNIKVINFNSSKIYYVSYVPRYIDSAREINLHYSSLGTPILVTPSNSNSNGEYFDSVGQDLRVRLSNNPYIDYTKFVNGTYSPFVGTITSSKTSNGNFDYSNYSPVKVILNDGTTARNITNYLVNNNSIEQFTNTTDLQFIHYGDSLVFNKQINQAFNVLYQYIPDSFRYRIVMRSLTSDEQNYTVDRLIFKFSTETKDSALINLIKYDNLFRNKVN